MASGFVAGTVFVGRDHELRALERDLAGEGGAEPRLRLLTGEPGIGKTRLAEELTRKAEQAGWTVAWGRAWEGEGTPAYFPWIQVLRKLAAATALRTTIDDARAASPELDALVGMGRARMGAAPADPSAAQFRLLEATTDLLHRAAADAPIVVVLDDIHAADLATLRLLHFVARGIRGSRRLLIVATARDVARPAAEGSMELLAKIAREAVAIALGRLARDELAHWMSAATPTLASNVDDVFAVSDGNPLFVEELLAASHKRGALAWRTTEGLPSGVRQAIRGHVELLSPPTQRVLEIASILGRDVDDRDVIALAQGEDVAAALAEAQAAGVLVRTIDHVARFTHVLVRDELYARLAPDRRAELHRAIAHRHHDEAHVAVQHWLAGARAEDAPEAARATLAAMREAIARLAFEDAARLGERAIAVLRAASLPDVDAGWLEVAVADAYNLAGKIDAARAACKRAAAYATTSGDAALLARAALAYAGERSHGPRDAESVRLLRAALEALPSRDSPLRAEVMARLFVALLPPTPDDVGHVHSLARDAMAMADRIGDDATRFAVLRFTSGLPPELMDARERASLNAEVIALAVRLKKVVQIASVITWQPMTYIEAGDADAAMRAADEAEELLSEFTQPQYRWRVPLMRASLAAHEGRFADADALGREALRIALDSELTSAASLCAVQRVTLHYGRGDGDGFDEFLPLFERTQIGPVGHLFLALPAALCGRSEAARAKLEAAIPRIHSIPAGGVFGWVCVHVGAREHAALFYELVRAEAARSTWMSGPGGFASLGPHALLLGRLAEMLGRDDDALAHFIEARTLAERARSAPFVAHADLALSRAYAEREPARARAHAEQAARLATTLGMHAVAEAASRGAPMPAPPAKASPSSRAPLTLARDGDTWRIEMGERRVVLRDGKGLAYLDALVQRPHEEIHVLTLVGTDDAGDAGPVLDERAKRAYRERAADLREALDEASANGDLGRAERARNELDALAAELARAVGLGGRDRRAASHVERARINVQRRLRDVQRRVAELDEAIGKHLERSVRTGVFCMYAPTWPG